MARNECQREKTNWKTQGKRVEKTKSMDFGSNLNLLPNCSPLQTLFYLDPNQSLAAPQPQPCACSSTDTWLREAQPAMAHALAHTCSSQYCAAICNPHMHNDSRLDLKSPTVASNFDCTTWHTYSTTLPQLSRLKWLGSTIQLKIRSFHSVKGKIANFHSSDHLEVEFELV